MPEFETYVDVDVDEFLYALNKREKNELIDALVEDGLVKRIVPRNSELKGDQRSLLEIEWDTMIDKLSDLRLRLTNEEEEQIKKIVNKYA
jgi:hypothetical protein